MIPTLKLSALILSAFAFLSPPASAGTRPEQAPSKLRAATLEFGDRWTKKHTGLAAMLRAGGFETEALSVQSLERVQLVAFGSFTNNDALFKHFVQQNARALRSFVERGGVILEMAQSDQHGAKVTFLPERCDVRRCDQDDSQLLVAMAGHPLLRGDWVKEDAPFSIPMLQGREDISWEGIDRWTGGQVLLWAGKSPDTHAALVEVAHGKGRYLISSLWFDKLADAEGIVQAPRGQQLAARAFAQDLVRYVRLVRRGKAPQVTPTPAPQPKITGPMLGHIDAQSARVWLRPTEAGRYTLELLGSKGSKARSWTLAADPAQDLCITWKIDGLLPDQEYRYTIQHADGDRAGELVVPAEACRFRTAKAPGSKSRVRLAFLSCASSKPSHAWEAIRLSKTQGLVLLGDTPYIDTTELERVREKHRQFLQVPGLARLIRSVPVWGTWDDHDFGRNDSDGTLPGKRNTRRGFAEYRALASCGKDGKGVYTSFRRGAIEVFLCDARYFARTEQAGPDDERPSLLGKEQWAWLEQGLRSSTAPFKIVATGMIWDDKKNRESDDWGSYPHERLRLENFVGENSISGVILLGGDIHVSRHLRYPETRQRVGYVLDQFIVSPLHEGVIPSLDVPHPALLWSAKLPRVYLTMDVDDTQEDPTLTARWVQDTGKGEGQELRRVILRASQLRR
jgi:phosphodiesterase/alkaline phosphatase D-like protein